MCALAGVPDVGKTAGARIPACWPSSSNQATNQASTNSQWHHLKDLPVESKVLLGSWAPISSNPTPDPLAYPAHLVHKASFWADSFINVLSTYRTKESHMMCVRL